ncbi:hypothetical protein ACPA9J_29290 [Pseudomonas aeruginosa]
MMAAALANGRTVLQNAAREPEVVDLANCPERHGRQRPGRWLRYHRHRRREAPRRRSLRRTARPYRRPAPTWWPRPRPAAG